MKFEVLAVELPVGVGMINDHAAHPDHGIQVAVEIRHGMRRAQEPAAFHDNHHLPIGDRCDHALHFDPLDIEGAAVDFGPGRPQRFRMLAGAQQLELAAFDSGSEPAGNRHALDLAEFSGRDSAARPDEVVDVDAAGPVLHAAVAHRGLDPGNDAASLDGITARRLIRFQPVDLLDGRQCGQRVGGASCARGWRHGTENRALEHEVGGAAARRAQQFRVGIREPGKFGRGADGDLSRRILQHQARVRRPFPDATAETDDFSGGNCGVVGDAGDGLNRVLLPGFLGRLENGDICELHRAEGTDDHSIETAVNADAPAIHPDSAFQEQRRQEFGGIRDRDGHVSRLRA